ncbi:MAG: class I SAM-dependent methyltransferase [Patescibacteria group bacterium]
MPENYTEKGDVNLDLLSKADNFSRWMFNEVKPFLGGTILEFGSGRGTYSKLILENFPQNKIVLSDIDIKYVDALKSKFPQENISVLRINLENTLDFVGVSGIDSAFALNVMEHVENDVQALNNIYEMLNPGGRFIMLVPAHKFLFNCIDTCVDHYRRYNKKMALDKVKQTKFKVKKMFYFNFLGMVGWYWNGAIMKKEILNENALKFFNFLVPALRFIEKYILRKTVGLSLVVVLEK